MTKTNTHFHLKTKSQSKSGAKMNTTPDSAALLSKKKVI